MILQLTFFAWLSASISNQILVRYPQCFILDGMHCGSTHLEDDLYMDFMRQFLVSNPSSLLFVVQTLN